MDQSQQRQILFALPLQSTHNPNPNTEDPPYHKEPKPYSLNNKPSTSKHTLPSHMDGRSNDNLSHLSSSSEDLLATSPDQSNEWQQYRKTKRKRTQASVHDAPPSPMETSNRYSVLGEESFPPADKECTNPNQVQYQNLPQSSYMGY